nr:MAG TPA: hypothetical protein [Caudoviricetes sp.]
MRQSQSRKRFTVFCSGSFCFLWRFEVWQCRTEKK